MGYTHTHTHTHKHTLTLLCLFHSIIFPVHMGGVRRGSRVRKVAFSFLYPEGNTHTHTHTHTHMHAYKNIRWLNTLLPTLALLTIAMFSSLFLRVRWGEHASEL